MKKLLQRISVFILIFVLFSNSMDVFAEEKSLFEEIVMEAAKYEDTMQVISENGADITGEFITIYINQGADIAKEYLAKNNGYITYQKIEDSSGIALWSMTRSKSVTQTFYHIKTSTKGGFTKEWLTKMTGSFSYDLATDEIISASSPTLSLEVADFGAAFSPYINSVRTSASINKTTNKVTYTGSYHMYATLGVSIGDLPLGLNLDFGSHTETMTGSL